MFAVAFLSVIPVGNLLLTRGTNLAAGASGGCSTHKWYSWTGMATASKMQFRHFYSYYSPGEIGAMLKVAISRDFSSLLYRW
jgi:hypothetical protein